MHVRSVRAVIGLDARGPAFTMVAAASRDLSLALGRVVAHELVHALAPSVPHGTGLMSAMLSYRQLTASSIPFDAEVGLAVQARPPWRSPGAAPRTPASSPPRPAPEDLVR